MNEKINGIIYMYTNKINNKKYIGLTTKSIEERHKKHIKGTNKNSYIHNALKKYGVDNFLLEIIDNADTFDELKNKERYWISYYDSKNNGYNLTDGGDGVLGYKHNEETKQIIREANLGENNHMYGKTFNDEHRRKLSESGKKRTHSEETKEKIKNNCKKFFGEENGRSKSVVQLSINNEYIDEFVSVREASIHINGDNSAIGKVCNGKLKQHKGYKWMFKDDYENMIKD